MNQNLGNLVSILEKQNETKQDFVVNSTNLHMIEGNIAIEMPKKKSIIYTPTNYFHSQVSEKLKIPKPYYDRMLEHSKNLLDENVNHWLGKNKNNVLVRTFSDVQQARAFLSSSYNILDNYEVLFETLACIKETGLDVEIVEADLSETRMYLSVVCPAIEINAMKMLKDYKPFGKTSGVGYGVMSGFTLQNSEIGAGSFQIMPRGVVKACDNGLVLKKEALKKIHLGSRMDELGFDRNEAVKAANIKLIKEQVKHAVKVFLSKTYLTHLVNTFSELGEKTIEAPVANVIEVISKQYSISEDRKHSILNHFIKQGDNRRIGLLHAMTEELQSLKDLDLKHETETIAFDILENFNRIEATAFKTKFTIN